MLHFPMAPLPTRTPGLLQEDHGIQVLKAHRDSASSEIPAGILHLFTLRQ